jgi:hypothetical protein
VVGGLVGTVDMSNFDSILVQNNKIEANECVGLVTGWIQNSIANNIINPVGNSVVVNQADHVEDKNFGCISGDNVSIRFEQNFVLLDNSI